jgi:poly(ADP-ribose) polymerase-like protein
MPHIFEPAASGRSKCRGCGQALEKGEIRFGERMANPFAEGTELTLWFHPMCATYKRPESMLEALGQSKDVANRAELEAAARASLAQRRLPRIDGAERAKGQANCRQCREPIPRGEWRIRLAFFEEGRFNPGGFIHVHCSRAYFETEDVLDRVLHFSRELSADDRKALSEALRRNRPR